MSSLVSVILPTFNRARFLPEAFTSIQAQSWPAWELIVVDDGSTDDTRVLVEQWRPRLERPVHYIYQQNGGAYAARNTGLDHASGSYVAFFDSDDLWLPHHLERCVSALDRHPDVQWVFAACRSVDQVTGRVIAPSTFYVGDKPRAFLALPARADGELRILDGPAVLQCQLTSGLYAGLQNSVIRRGVFEGERFWEDYRVVEDVLFLARALSRSLTIGYIDDVHVVYRVHDDNSSASATGVGSVRLLPIFEEEVRGFERVRAEVQMPPEARAVLERQLGAKYFWRLGYAGFWQAGKRAQALRAFRMGLRLRPFDWRMWKTYALCYVRALGRP
jgi:glycosyltransferase involved in cell wall biosynthesis